MIGDKKANLNYREYLTAFIGHGRDKFQKATITANISGACNIKHVKSRYEWNSTHKKGKQLFEYPHLLILRDICWSKF
jgi:hypothetical protein